jgi:transposase InsO family protein
LERGEVFHAHAFEFTCAQNDIDHRLTKPRHPWTNGQVERMNRTFREAIVKRYHYDTHDQLRSHLADFVTAYNFGRRLKEGFKARVAAYIERTRFRREAPWTRSARTARVSI